MRALRRASLETLRFVRDDPIGFFRVLGLRLADGKQAAAYEYKRRRG